MTNLRFLLVAVLLALSAGLSAPAAASAEDEPGGGSPSVVSDPAAIRALFADRTVDGHYGSGVPFTEYYAPDGRSAYIQYQCLHQGRWWIETLNAPFGPFRSGLPVACFTYPTLDGDRPPSCFVVGGPPGRELFYAIGGLPSRATIPTALVDGWRPGNPDNLKLGEDNCPSS